MEFNVGGEMSQRRRVVFLLLLCGSCLAILSAVGPQGALANDCTKGDACGYTGTGYLGPENKTSCGAYGAHRFVGWKKSGKNHCANRAIWLRATRVAKLCLNPGREVEATGFNEIWIGARNSHC
jgi:hypothetical protein